MVCIQAVRHARQDRNTTRQSQVRTSIDEPNWHTQTYVAIQNHEHGGEGEWERKGGLLCYYNAAPSS